MEEIDQKYQADSEYEKIVAKRSGKKRLIEERLQTVDQNEERE